MKLESCIERAYGVLDGVPLSRELAAECAALQGPAVLDLASLANKVRVAFCPQLHVCTILSTRSGRCGEDCRFCAQSGHHEAVVDVYPLMEVEAIVERAEACHRSGVRHFGLVTSGLGFPEVDDVFRRILDAMDEIARRFPELGICASLGLLGEEPAAELGKRNVVHYNINLQTNPERYAELISRTHTVEHRIQTIRRLQGNGIRVCSGGILGIGESMEDRIELAYALRELDVDVIPLNVLVPIPGTPLAEQPRVRVMDVVKTFAIFRLVHPRKVIKFAAGRETVMSDFQGLLMLAGANGFLTGGYLTTRGRDVADDVQFERELESFGEG